MNYDEEEKQELRDKEEENKIGDENGLIDYKTLERLFNLKNRGIINEFVRKHFQIQFLVSLLEKLKRSKNNAERNKIQVSFNNSGLRDLKEEFEDMSKQEKEILEFNRQQQGQGLKILSPSQMLSRLPISLAYLKAENNSGKNYCIICTDQKNLQETSIKV